jgi:hypothetical protein
MKPRYFVLRHGRVHPTPGNRPWARWLHGSSVEDRTIACDVVADVTVTTVFVGVVVEGQEPMLFITSVFGGAMDGCTRRSATPLEALATHNDVLTLVKG